MLDLVGHAMSFDPHRSRKTPTAASPLGSRLQAQHDSTGRSNHSSICIGTCVTAGQVLRVGDQREVRSPLRAESAEYSRDLLEVLAGGLGPCIHEADLWARRVSNLRPLACEASALPLSYAPWEARFYWASSPHDG